MTEVNFDYELPGGTVIHVETTVSAGRPEVYPDLHQPGAPAECAEVEISVCYIDKETICLDDLYLKDASGKFIQVEDDIREMAEAAYDGDGRWVD